MDWWQKGFEGFIEWHAMLRRMWGGPPTPWGSWDKNRGWEDALQNYQKLFQDYIKLFGFVLGTDYDRVKNKYDRLKEEHELLKIKSEIQEETIHNLQALLAAQTMDPAGLAKPFTDLISKQTEQFQRLMFGMFPGVKKTSSGEDEDQ